MAAYNAAESAVSAGRRLTVTVLEKMPRPARKLMITGKGRCNFSNLKDWQSFSAHIQTNRNFLRPAFYSLPPDRLLSFFESLGVATVVERGDRAFPASHLASDIVDALVNACRSRGVRLETGAEVYSVTKDGDFFAVTLNDGRFYESSALIIATGGRSYPTTGSSGDGLLWAASLGHRVTQTFPALTALVPKGYKTEAVNGTGVSVGASVGIVNGTGTGPESSEGKFHIHRNTPLAGLGKKFCGREFKYVTATLFIDGCSVAEESGELYFTDGGIEGPVGFQLSRKAVKALVNGSAVSIKVLVNPLSPEKDRMEWSFPIAGYVGYERAVITAGGVSTDEVFPKTMGSRLVHGLFFCGEVLDVDADTGGYNLQLAFCTGALAGHGAVSSL